MAARAIWRGQIRLALVSIPIELFPATKSGAQIQFHQIHEPSGKRIKYEKVVPGIGPVDRDEIVKGYEVSKGHYVLLDPEVAPALAVPKLQELLLGGAGRLALGAFQLHRDEEAVVVVPREWGQGLASLHRRPA